MATFLRAGVLAADPAEISLPAPAAPVRTQEQQSAGAYGTPARIRIPAIGVDAEVVDVGVGKSGNMAVPYTYTQAGWYRYGPEPGQEGSAVLDGHVDNGFGIPAVFARLGELKAGDDLYIDTINGNTLRFTVEEAGSYAVGDAPLQKIFNRSDKPRLNLITCEGSWLPDEKMYDERRVVYAALSTE